MEDKRQNGKTNVRLNGKSVRLNCKEKVYV